MNFLRGLFVFFSACPCVFLQFKTAFLASDGIKENGLCLFCWTAVLEWNTWKQSDFFHWQNILIENPWEKAGVPAVTWLAFLLKKWIKAVISVWTNPASFGLRHVPEILKKERGVAEWRVLALSLHPFVEHWSKPLLHDMVCFKPQ